MSVITLILLSPVFLLLMMIIKADSPGPAIYKQKRLGLHGKVFFCYKLRTMYENNHVTLEKLFEDDPCRAVEWQQYAKLKGHDARVTRSGEWLRRWSLDELPQLINVLQGDMSLVGPRPYLIEERSRMGESADNILSVLPGITGLWQVSGRNEIDFCDRLQIEKYYALNRSLKIDLMIMIKTIGVVVSQKGTY